MTIKTVRHDIHSMFQSVAEEVARRQDQEEGTASEARGTTDGRRPTVEHPTVAAAAAVAEQKEAGQEPSEDPPEELKAKHGGAIDTVWDCTKLASDLFEAKLRRQADRVAQLEDEMRFSTCDPRWAEAISDYVGYFGPEGKKNEIPYIRYRSLDDFVLETLPKNARVAILGDWGTGMEDAVATLERVREHKPDVVIHLGDIYYSGTEKECKSYFLDILNQVLERDENPVPVYTLTGNHDMYSGGVGYYGLLPQLNPSPPFEPAQAQPASYFVLRSPGGRWQLQALDTGLHDHDPFTVTDNVTYLDPKEEVWHVDKIRRWHGRTILFSHHQLFSAFSGIGKLADKKPAEAAVNPKLLASFEKFKAAGDVAAWFWGHEHNLGIYEPFAGLAKGRCMGHGAIPVFVDSDPYTPLSGLTDPPQLVDDLRNPGQKVMLGKDDIDYTHGYVILDLDDDHGTAVASYYQETDPEDDPMYRERL